MRKVSAGGVCPIKAALCLFSALSAGMAQAQEPSLAHSSTMQTVTVTQPTGGWTQAVSFDYLTNTSVHTTVPRLGHEVEHEVVIRQHTTTPYAFENWGGAWIYDIDAGQYSGVMFFVQQPLPGLPVRPTYEEPVFGAVTGYATGDAPMSVVTADLNGDALPDLAVACRDGVAGTTYLNNAAAPGNFTSRANYSVPGSPQALCAGNFDKANRDEIAWGGFNSNDIRIFTNNGAGALNNPGTTYATGTRPLDMEAADLNGDGSLDIVQVGQGGITVHTNNGSGGFTMTYTYNFGEAYGVEAIDADGDEDLDLVAIQTWPTSKLHVFLNQGGTQGGTKGVFSGVANTGLLTTTGIASQPGFPSGLTSGDFNNDGKADIAVAHGTGHKITVWAGGGDATFSTPLELTVPSTVTDSVKITKGDFNGDGKLDLAAAGGNGTNDIAVFGGLGDGSFADIKLLSSGGANLYGIAAGDFDGNGSDDLAVVSKATDSLRVLRTQ